MYYCHYEGHAKHSVWVREELNCSNFLVLMLCWQAVHGGLPYTGWAQVGPEGGEAIIRRWGTIWKSRDLRACYRAGQAVCIAGPTSTAVPGMYLDLLVAAALAIGV